VLDSQCLALPCAVRDIAERGAVRRPGWTAFALSSAGGGRENFWADSAEAADNRGTVWILSVLEVAVRRIRYQVAMSLDGYIAGPEGEFDWIISDSEIDFGALFAQFDTLLVGRGTFEFMVKHGQAAVPGMKIIVFSRTLQQRDFPDVTIIAGKEKETVAALRAQPGKDIWLFGGGLLFRSFLDAGLVDTVEVAVIPVMLGGGIPLLPAPAQRAQLQLTRHKVYQSGIVLLEYSTQHSKT
jgi:dihydrofolate reductase